LTKQAAARIRNPEAAATRHWSLASVPRFLILRDKLTRLAEGRAAWVS
jgi:hypothetical protein